MGLFDKPLAVGGPGSLFNRSPVTEVPLALSVNAVPGTFYALEHEGKVVGHALFKEPVEPGPLQVGPKVPLACMFTAHWLMRGTKQLGFAFSSHYPVINEGGYLLTQSSKASIADPTARAEALVKTEDLVIFNFPNRGTLIVSPVIDSRIEAIFEHQ